MTDGKDKAPKDNWDKFEILAKVLPAIAVAFIAILGNYYLQNKQKADNNLKLYTQLLANKENSENTLRKDMFFEMLKSFLSPEKSDESGEQTITKIREKLFSLELLARNFHESLDMKPLFKHVLMEIVRPRIKMRKQNHQLRPIIGLFELIIALETIPNEDDLGEQEIKDQLFNTIEKIKRDYYSVTSLAKKEKEIVESLNGFNQNLRKPDTQVHAVSEELMNKLVGMIDKDVIKKVLKNNSEWINKPDTTVNSENTKPNYLLLYMTNKDDLKETFEKIDQRLFEPTVVNRPELEVKIDLVRLNEILSKIKIDDEDVTKLYELLIPVIKKQYEKAHKELSQFDQELDRLLSVAKRVTRKQIEILEDVAGKFSLTIPLPDDENPSTTICTSVKPNEEIIIPGICPEPEGSEPWKKGHRVDGVKEEGELFYLDSNGFKVDQSTQYFSIHVRYVYPRWRQVYVEIITCPKKANHDEYLNSLTVFNEENQLNKQAFLKREEGYLNVLFEKLKNKYKIDRTTYDKMIENNFELYFKPFLKDYYGVEESAFWLEYFDFPLVDNSYISSKQRYSVILEDFKSGPEGEDESAKISLLYYPASYAGLKEKSFYNNQLMHNLMEDEFFSKNR